MCNLEDFSKFLEDFSLNIGYLDVWKLHSGEITIEIEGVRFSKNRRIKRLIEKSSKYSIHIPNSGKGARG